jgi:hypothetical protein
MVVNSAFKLRRDNPQKEIKSTARQHRLTQMASLLDRAASLGYIGASKTRYHSGVQGDDPCQQA